MLQQLIKFKPETEEKIYYYKRIITFSVALLTFITLLIYNQTRNEYLLELLVYMFCSYLFGDLFISKGDAIWHHIFSLFCCYSGIQFIPVNFQHVLFLPICNTEISTVFLIIKLWMDEYKGKKNTIFNILYSINDIVFVSLFFKLRI